MEKIIKDKWNDILEFMKTEYNITDVAYRTWLLPLSVHSVKDNTIIISVDDTKIAASITWLMQLWKVYAV